MISIIIATRNRPEQLARCIKSILRSSYQNFELWIFDQSDDEKTRRVIDKLSETRVRYYKLNYKGKSKALNLGIKKSKGELVVFTDDDCIVSKHWLSGFNNLFKKETEIAAAFGRTIPYLPNKRKNKVCISCQQSRERRVYDNPFINTIYFLGNCMAIRKRVFREMGVFKEWLGVGSKSFSAEDGEFIYRILLRRLKVLYEPKIIVYHDRWLSKSDARANNRKYTVGYFSAFTYHALRTEIGATRYLIYLMKLNSRTWIKTLYRSVTKFHPRLFAVTFLEIFSSPINWVYYARGIVIGIYYAFKTRSGFKRLMMYF